MIWSELESSGLSILIKESGWLLPVLQSVHLCAMALLGGSELMVNLRMLGFGLFKSEPRDVVRESKPWMKFGLAGLVASGLLIFASEATKLYDSTTFRVKVVLFLLALIFTFAVRNPVAHRAFADGDRKPKTCAAVSLALWLGVAVAGRWIGFT